MKLNNRTIGAIATFVLSNVLIWIWELSTGVSLDPFYYLDWILQVMTKAFTSLMPTNGLLAQSTEEYLIMVNVVHIILKLLPSILLAAEAYHLIPDDFMRNQQDW
jgi:hypothetical protein